MSKLIESMNKGFDSKYGVSKNSIKMKEAANPDNAKANELIQQVLRGDTRSKKALDQLKKMGYDAEIDSSARKAFGRRYFGDRIKIVNPKTGRQFIASANNEFRGDDRIVATPVKDSSVSNPDLYKRTTHEVNPSRLTRPGSKAVNPKAFDYKGYLDKPIYDDTPKPTTVQQFAQDRDFLKRNEYTAQQIDAARDRVRDVRKRLGKDESLQEEYQAKYIYKGNYKSGKQGELARFFTDEIYDALESVYQLAKSKIKGLPNPSVDDADEYRSDDLISELADALVDEYFGNY